jgi:hypothetical protein
MSVDLNKTSVDFLDKKPLTKNDRTKKETEYIVIVDMLKEAILLSKVNWEVCSFLNTRMVNKSISKKYVLEVMEYLGFDFGSLSMFKRKLINFKLIQ